MVIQPPNRNLFTQASIDTLLVLCLESNRLYTHAFVHDQYDQRFHVESSHEIDIIWYNTDVGVLCLKWIDGGLDRIQLWGTSLMKYTGGR